MKWVTVYPEVILTPERRHTMTYKSDYSIPEEVLEQICEEGFDALPDLIRIMINEFLSIATNL